MLLKIVINSTLEPFNCTVVGDFNGSENIIPTRLLKFIFLNHKIFPLVMSVVLFSRLHMSCAPFLLFRYIWIENGMIWLPLYVVS